MLEQLPLTRITALISIVLLIIFFVTSSDSGSLMVNTIASGGKFDAPAGVGNPAGAFFKEVYGV